MKRIIYTLDLETDPFETGREPKAFAAGLFDGETYWSEWGDDCVTRMLARMAKMQAGIVYVHNGGRFDVYVSGGKRIIESFDTHKPLTIINSRIISAQMLNGWEFRDSYAIFPFPLSKYKKDDVDFTRFERNVRDAHKDYILKYLRNDCVYLHELCLGFHSKFGSKLTIGSAAMTELKKLHKYTKLSDADDALVRDGGYFYGGRVQCFEKGILYPWIGNQFKVYDINQSYPNAMRNYDHPISEPILCTTGEITPHTFFVTVRGRNHNAFPSRMKNGLSFTRKDGVFAVSIHEYRAAVELGMFEPDEVISTLDFAEYIRFENFVDTFHKLRKHAQLGNDTVGALFYKYVCNSAYGKFAQNKDHYKEYVIALADVDMHPLGFEREVAIDLGNLVIWSKPATNVSIFNVATGASITGAARSVLIRALANAKRPIYCDTDSIICEDIGDSSMIDDTRLGYWKLEKCGDRAAIAGKKLYAIFSGAECVKMATKGVRLPASDIERVARGEKVTFINAAPTYQLGSGQIGFLKRDVTMT